MAADFRRYYGDSVDGFRCRGVPLVEVAAMAAHLPPESATWRAMNPDHVWGLPEQLLALTADRLAVLIWAKTRDGQRGRNFPKPIPRPGVEPDEATTTYGKGGAVPLDEMAAWLGWDDPTARGGGDGAGR